MRALAEMLDSDERGAHNANKLAEVGARYEEAWRRAHVDAESEFQERLVHEKITRIEADIMVLTAILNSPGRPEDEKGHAATRIRQEELPKLHGESAYRRMWVAWESRRNAAPHVLQCTGNLVAVSDGFLRDKWPLFVHHQAGNMTGDAKKIAQYVEMKYGSEGDAGKDDKSGRR
ncbi:hypothetical protein VMCG_02012 [Cytospora schulzeri]|uniref:Uncharacterized protein n=1 Tax=Cytospora schulzeri TaxID=448051 RepID=A0A423X2W7_9PEZI|nr:hypothetical protein VMCG_02012 [Valsa malicola]